METFYTDNQNYTAADAAALKDIEPALNNAKATPAVGTTAAADNYVVKSDVGDRRRRSRSRRTCGRRRDALLRPATGSYGCPTQAAAGKPHAQHHAAARSGPSGARFVVKPPSYLRRDRSSPGCSLSKDGQCELAAISSNAPKAST